MDLLETTKADITELLIQGAGYRTPEGGPEDLKLVHQFAESLRESPFLATNGVTIAKIPDPSTEFDTFNFTLRAKLAKPVSM